MRLLPAALVAAVAFLTPLSAFAEGPTFADRDVEEEDAERSLGVFLNPLGAAIGVYGGEVDFVVAKPVTLNVAGAFYSAGGASAKALSFGAQLFPIRGAFRGLYVYPQVTAARASVDGTGVGADLFGAGGTIGWQWLWEYGLSVRVGGGAMIFSRDVSGDAGAVALSGARPVADASFGWTF